MEKRKPDANMVLDIDGKEIDVEVFVDESYKALRYDLTSKAEIDPIEAAFILMSIARSICMDAGVHPDIVFENYSPPEESDGFH